MELGRLIDHAFKVIRRSTVHAIHQYKLCNWSHVYERNCNSIVCAYRRERGTRCSAHNIFRYTAINLWYIMKNEKLRLSYLCSFIIDKQLTIWCDVNSSIMHATQFFPFYSTSFLRLFFLNQNRIEWLEFHICFTFYLTE